MKLKLVENSVNYTYTTKKGHVVNINTGLKPEDSHLFKTVAIEAESESEMLTLGTVRKYVFWSSPDFRMFEKNGNLVFSIEGTDYTKSFQLNGESELIKEFFEAISQPKPAESNNSASWFGKCKYDGKTTNSDDYVTAVYFRFRI